jgi:hypothetical protein
MTQGEGEIVARRCPRCGGLMSKPAGSSLFWHADNNHPRCDITNIVDSPETLPPRRKTVEDRPAGKASGDADNADSTKKQQK